ncbi:MAG: hypothetical protein GY804_00635 [Alphaproteobacteria bacterium]|nr:hypothetical protein [Alphaproteobacteria bacterium]
MSYDKLKSKKYIEQNGICPACGELLPAATSCQLGHILPQRQWLKRLYGEEIIHHPMNMKLVHPCDDCNNGVQMSPNKTRLVNNHVQAIKDKIDEEAVC